MREKNGVTERGRGKWQRGSAGAYSLLWNASRRVSQVCWPAATAARAGRSVLYSMVADVRYDDDRAKMNADGKISAVGARSIESF